MSLVIGGIGALLVLAVYVAGLLRRGQDGLALPLVYNAPIGFLFLVLAVESALYFFIAGMRRALVDRGTIVAVWIIGFVVLILRLGGGNVEISGHMTWLPILTAQSFVLRFPYWFTLLGAMGTAIAIWLKFAVFRGPSGLPGILTGVVLAIIVLVFTRRRN